MTDIFNDILNHLKDSSTNTDVDITDFIKQLPYTKPDTTDGTITIFKAFNHLKSKNYVIPVVTNSDKQTFNFDETVQDYIRKNPKITFNTLKAVANITNDGLNYLEQKERDKRQDYLLEIQTDSIWKTSKATESVGQSTIKLNEEIIPSNNRLQRKLGYRTLLIAGISMLAIIASVYVASKGVTSKDINRIDTLLQRNTQLLDSIRISQKGIDSSLRTMANDSTKNILIETKSKTE